MPKRDDQILSKMRLVSLILFAFLSLCLCKKLFKYDKSVCAFSPKFVENGTCTVQVKSDYSILTNIDYDVIIPLKNAFVKLEVYKLHSDLPPVLFSESFSLCESTKGLSYLGKSTLKHVKQFTNSILCELKVS